MAGAAVGVIVAVWHLPFFLLPGTTQNASSFVMFLADPDRGPDRLRLPLQRSGGSILLVILLHASGNTWCERLGTGTRATAASAPV